MKTFKNVIDTLNVNEMQEMGIKNIAYKDKEIDPRVFRILEYLQSPFDSPKLTVSELSIKYTKGSFEMVDFVKFQRTQEYCRKINSGVPRISVKRSGAGVVIIYYFERREAPLFYSDLNLQGAINCYD